MLLLKEELSRCVQAEDFEKAARLRDEVQSLQAVLGPLQQHEHYLIQQLQRGTMLERVQALKSLAEVSSSQHVVRKVADCLRFEHLAPAAESALQAIWLRHPTRADINEQMAEGLRLMRHSQTYESALLVFDQVVHLDPDYAEGWNKRATLKYLLQRFREALDDCEVAVRLQPLHFGALSGMGLCHLQLQEYSRAIAAFERALEINPTMTQIQRYLKALRVENP